MWAAAQDGNKAYSTGGTIDNFEPGMRKCNEFVVDAYEKGAKVGQLPRQKRFKFWKERYPLQANDLADPKMNVPHFPVVKGGKLQVGDIVSYPVKGGLGHTSIYMGGGMVTQASGTHGVRTTSVTYNPHWNNMVVRRYAP
ncbi:MAG: C40 family peptidase [Phycisphaerae bacterium]|nr:C40 family peptidase [Phycisphaerae bacterium]